MIRQYATALAVAALVAAPQAVRAQDEVTRAVASGGIMVPGWSGKIDDSEAKKGMKLEDAKLEMSGDDLHVTTGPAVSYWSASNEASGNYMVKATFTEAEYMSLNSHPHPYGIFIAGKNMGTDQQSYLYCAAYGNGNFIVRGFGPAPFQMNGRGEANPAVNKAAGKGASVTQEIAMSVTPTAVECAINGKTVASYPKADVMGAGKLSSTDGVFGVRFGHNTDAVVKGLSMMKH